MNAKEAATIKKVIKLLKRNHNDEPNLGDMFAKEAADKIDAISLLEEL